MSRGFRNEIRPMTMVLGCGEIGSAIAVALHRAGFAVVLIDEVDPAWIRRGMALTNAWYVGNAELDGEEAIFCASLRSIPTVLDRNAAIAATTWSWPGVASALEPVALVDARVRRQGPAISLRSRAPDGLLTIGVGPGFVVGEHVHAAVGSACGERRRCVPCEAGTERERAVRPGSGGAGRFVCSTVSGRFSTSRRIGDHVECGEAIGAIGNEPVAAPLTGVLRGLSARGARVEPRTKVLEVDTRNDPALCFGVEERPRSIAEGVLTALARACVVPHPRANGSRGASHCPGVL
jgi:xanthine dehydrogenase accessory factor